MAMWSPHCSTEMPERMDVATWRHETSDIIKELIYTNTKMTYRPDLRDAL